MTGFVNYEQLKFLTKTLDTQKIKNKSSMWQSICIEKPHTVYHKLFRLLTIE